jgi:chemotaxis protein MotB
MRRLKTEYTQHHERWLVSYADFVTLLFAFFVVMYSISSVNNKKYQQLSGALDSAFKGEAMGIKVADSAVGPVVPSILPPQSVEAIAKKRLAMSKLADTLMQTLSPLVSSGKIHVTQNAMGVSVDINASVLFLPGEAKLSDESSLVLAALATVMRADTHSMRVEGHTDNIQISNATYASNWELSAVRAGSVVRLLERSGITENRLTVVGHGSAQPVVPNNTADNRSRNRRVTVSILSD